MNRRRFLTTTTSVSAWLAANPALLSAAPPPRIPIGFLGASYSHGPDKLRIAMTSPDWEFVGACDATPVGRANCERLGARLISRDELFARARVVAVESEIRDHAADGLLALKAGKHVHLEKPPATTLADMRAVVALAREKGLLLQTGFMWRSHPGFRVIFEAVREGWLGEVYLVRGHISNSLAAPRRVEWAEFAGGSMFDLGSHLVDATVRLLGKPKAVTAVLRHHGRFEDSLKDNNVAVLEYGHASGIVVNTALQAPATPPRSFEVLGTRGTAVLQPIEPPTLFLDLTAAAGPYRQGRQQIELPAYERYVGDFAELASAVRGERSLTASLDQELTVAETLLEASGMV